MLNKNKKRGFTLLELLIVIGILAVLAGVMIFILNPAETLRKARDSQRLSDLATLKSALGIYMSSAASPQIDGTSGTANDKCLGGGGTKTIYWSNATSGANTSTTNSGFDAFSVSTSGVITGSGWVPVNLSSLSGGSPISAMPIDPSNTTSSVATSSLVYRYACRKSPLGFEINSQLESDFYTGVSSGAADWRKNDSGNESGLYEVGTDLTILLAASSSNAY